MDEPLVCAVMLVNGREAMTRRAIESFRSQGYPNAMLLIWDNGDPRVEPQQKQWDRIWWWTGERKSVGAMRNDAIAWALSGPTPHPDIFLHADSDDVMHPQRIDEQVALLKSTGAEAVGYREAVFYDQRPGKFCGAWMYRSKDPAYAIGASLCYWRKTWQRVQFPDLPKPGSTASEDRYFTARVKCVGVSGIGEDGEPRLIAGVHGRNSADYSWLGKNQNTRAPEFDTYCWERMRLET